MRALVVLLILAGSAQAASHPNPPTYFSLYRVWGGIAAQIIENCKEIELNRLAYDRMYEENMLRIEAEGFSRENWRNEMDDIPVGLLDRPKFEFFFKYGVRDDRPESWCLAGRAEMRAGTLAGQLLKVSSQ